MGRGRHVAKLALQIRESDGPTRLVGRHARHGADGPGTAAAAQFTGGAVGAFFVLAC
jgi:hypothetical protein